MSRVTFSVLTNYTTSAMLMILWALGRTRTYITRLQFEVTLFSRHYVFVADVGLEPTTNSLAACRFICGVSKLYLLCLCRATNIAIFF